MYPTVTLAVLVTLIFALLGAAKILALPRMRELATDAGFSVDAYRRIGGLELAGAIGVALGPAVPQLGVLAAAGLLALLAGAVATHLRHGDGIGRMAPALVCLLLVAGYLGALIRAGA